MRTVAVTFQGDMHWGQWSSASASPASIPNLSTVVRDHHRTSDTSQKVTDLARKKVSKAFKRMKSLIKLAKRNYTKDHNASKYI